MCAEGFGSIIRRNEEVGLLHGCRIAQEVPVISHLLFADNCYFFPENEGEASTMKNILLRYATISDQVINFDKSAINFSSNTKVENRRVVCECWEYMRAILLENT